MKDAGKIVRLFASVARPIMRRWLSPNSCIAATRVMMNVLGGAHGLTVNHYATQLVVEAPSKKFMFLTGFEGEEKAEISACCEAAGGTWMDRQYDDGDTWTGHVIGIAGGRYFIDCSIDQASSPEHGFVVSPQVFVADLGPAGEGAFFIKGGLEVCAILDDGTPFRVRYRRLQAKREYMLTDAWNDEGLHWIGLEITAAMADVVTTPETSR